MTNIIPTDVGLPAVATCAAILVVAVLIAVISNVATHTKQQPPSITNASVIKPDDDEQIDERRPKAN